MLSLSLRSYAPNTLASYGPHWLAFVRFCEERGRVSLPAEPATVALYLASVMLRGTVLPTSIRPYRAAINSVHRLVLGSAAPQPASDALVDSFVRGWTRTQLAQPGAQAEVTMPLPASAARRALDVVLAPSSSQLEPRLLRSLVFLVVAFATLMRPGSNVPLAWRDVERSSTRCAVRPREIKNGQLNPVLPAPKPFPVDRAPWFARLLDRWREAQVAAFTAAGRAHACPGLDAVAASSFWALPADRVIPAAGLSIQASSDAWIAAAVAHLGVRPPLGGKYTPKCTRKGGASAFTAIGGPPGALCFLGDWAPGSPVPEKHYVDRSVVACDAARLFFAFRLAG